MTADEAAGEAVATLAGPRIRIADAPDVVPPRPGLYAIWGGPDTWVDLGLKSTAPDSPLYVGKSESSLLDREVLTHFNASTTRKPATGSSTVRRSFAALLRGQLSLEVTPRNPAKPAQFSHFGLTATSDAILTTWMADHLELTVWEAPPAFGTPLDAVEAVTINCWDPPLNIKSAPPRPRLRQLRRELAAAAKTWAEENAG